LLKDCEASAKSCAINSYVLFCLDEEDSFVDEINDFVAANLAVFKSSQYVLHFHIENGTDTRHSQIFAYMLEV